jgi:hypothetical protein
MKRKAGISREITEGTAKSAGRNPFVFIVGCPRSGTTLLQRMIDAHPQVAIIYETHWIAKWYERRKGVTPEGTVTPKLITRLAEYHRFANWPISREDLERLASDGEPVSYKNFVSGFFDLYGNKHGKLLVGDKTPGYVRSVSTLHKLWPEAKFVHMIRDGRDVCLSAVDWRKSFKLARRFPTWREDPVTTVALWWKWFVSLGREDGGPLGPELYHEMRYESLVANPVDECVALCEFLGVPYDDAVVRFAEGRTMANPAFDAKQAWLPVTPGLRNWRSQMPPEDVERFEAVAGDLLEELGYPRAFPIPSSEALECVSKIRKSFTQDVRTQGQRLPEGW